MERIAFFFGIPINDAEYTARREQSDYLKGFRAVDDGEVDPRYRDRTMQPLQSLAALAQKFGHEVQISASLADLAETSRRANVIVLISHWKDFTISNNDLLDRDWKHFYHDVQQRNEPLTKWLADRLASHNGGVPDGAIRPWARWMDKIRRAFEPDMNLRELLEASLDANISAETPQLKEVSTGTESHLARRTRRREKLDQLFPSRLVPGNRIEFFDGLHERMALAEAIDQGFEGTLDFTTCTSKVLIQSIRMVHQDRMRTIAFPVELDLKLAGIALEATLDLIDNGMDYMDARTVAFDLISEQAKHLHSHAARQPSQSSPT